MVTVIMIQEPPNELQKLPNSTVCNITAVLKCAKCVYILDSAAT